MAEKGNGWILILLVILSIWFWRDHHNLTSRVESLQDEVADLDNKVNSYSDALDQANSSIEDAQSYAWSSYDDMGYALDNLETVEP
ncbi:MAG: hypothetical protein WC849_02315 [Candidatus Paceibacterota bacterium]